MDGIYRTFLVIRYDGKKKKYVYQNAGDFCRKGCLGTEGR